MKKEPRRDNRPGDELALIRNAKKGDGGAFSALVKTYQKRIYRLVYRFCRDHDAADDLAQETFVKAYCSLDKFREEFRFYSWLSAIAANLALNHLKQQKRQVSMEDYPISEIVADPSSNANPAKNLTDKELRSRLEEEIDKLPPEFKVTFVLRMYEDLSYEQIAERLGVEIGTVMSRLFRARSRLKKALEEYL